MGLEMIAGIVIVAGSVLFTVAAAPGPNIYRLTDPAEQLALIAEHRSSWMQVLYLPALLIGIATLVRA